MLLFKAYKCIFDKEEINVSLIKLNMIEEVNSKKTKNNKEPSGSLISLNPSYWGLLQC